MACTAPVTTTPKPKGRRQPLSPTRFSIPLPLCGPLVPPARAPFLGRSLCVAAKVEVGGAMAGVSPAPTPLRHRYRCAYCAGKKPRRNGARGFPSLFAASSSSALQVSGSSGFISGVDMSFPVQAMSAAHGSVVAPTSNASFTQGPDHLLVLVHGIMASPSDWSYAEMELKRQLGSNFLIYVSASNTYMKTFDGVDGAGQRLADEVMQIVRKRNSLQKISFLAHSLGGLFARYAIGVLYSSNVLTSDHKMDLVNYTHGDTETQGHSSELGTVAGLKPINFITLASPHLGVRGNKQLPFLLGLPVLEKLAPPIAPFLVGQTGSQLFLTDEKPSKPPLLLRMASDSGEYKFLSSLGAFQFRTLYANVSYDHMVGWRTSSIRRETELVKPPGCSLEGYKHVVNVEHCSPISSESPIFSLEAARAKQNAQVTPIQENSEEYHDIMEEEMIHGLQRVGWKKVDVSFHSALLPFFAHNNIHVKSEWLNNAGAGVIAHVADSIKQQESETTITAIL